MTTVFARLLLGNRVLRRLNTAVTRSRIWWAAQREHRLRQSHPRVLTNFEKRIYSQNGEDGIIQEIFRRIATKDKYFVEIGVGYRPGTKQAECNTRHLVEDHRWSGIWIDAGEAFVADSRQKFEKFPLRIEQHFVQRDTIASALQRLGVGMEFDLLSIDIDGNDYWIWKELAAFRPRVVIMEYNGAFVPGQDWVMDYNPTHSWDTTYYFGASLDAYERLGKELGYVLVGCDSNGINAFFVRRDLAEDKFEGVGAGTRYHYNAPKHNPHFYGFPPSTTKRIVLR